MVNELHLGRIRPESGRRRNGLPKLLKPNRGLAHMNFRLGPRRERRKP